MMISRTNHQLEGERGKKTDKAPKGDGAKRHTDVHTISRQPTHRFTRDIVSQLHHLPLSSKKYLNVTGGSRQAIPGGQLI